MDGPCWEVALAGPGVGACPAAAPHTSTAWRTSPGGRRCGARWVCGGRVGGAGDPPSAAVAASGR